MINSVYYQKLFTIYKAIKTRLTNTSGVASVEYAVIVAGLSVIIISLVTQSGPIGQMMIAIWSSVDMKIQDMLGKVF